MEVDEKAKLLRKAKIVLIKELCLDLHEEPALQKRKEKPGRLQKNMFAVASKKELRQVISDAAKKQLGLKKLTEKLLHNKGKFEVAEKTYRIKSSSLEKINGIVRKLYLKKGCSRANLLIIVNKLVALFKHEIAAAASDECNCKNERRKD